MLASLSLAAVAALSFSATTLAQGICKDAPYNALTCLGDVAAAKSACADVPEQTKTVTMTTTTLDVLTSSTTQMAASQNQMTVEVTSTGNRTSTVTKGPTSTVTDIQMSTAYENATLTTYIPCTLEAAAVPTVELVAEETCDAVVALPALASITANSILATACSCMGNPVPTTTITETVNAPAVQATTTDVAGTPKTTTLYALTLVTQIETVAPLATVAVSSATTLTSYATVSLTAPTFAPVFDPKAGCAHVNVSKKQALPPKIKSLPKAIEKCQAICEQESSCKSVYVQHMFENWSGKTPHYVCEMSEKFLKPRRDLRCGKKESIFGKARGFDAQGRGV